jgi:hypothetical protein
MPGTLIGDAKIYPETLDVLRERGGTWACGHVGCCDSSKNKHASGHFRTTRHPVIRSFQPGETWRYCYIDNQMAESE